MNRIYVCHTYYNVYVSILKELHFQKIDNQKGTIALSMMSTDFKNLKVRLLNTNVFDDVIELNEVHPRFFKKKFNYALKSKNWFYRVLIEDLLYWRYIAIQEKEYLNIDFRKYKDIFVYCDSDPIGKYLNYNKLYYHAVEDGLDSCKLNSEKRNSKFFYFRLILAKLGLNFVKDGYSRYAIDLEVNDLIGVDCFGRNVISVPRKQLFHLLSTAKKKMLYDVFYLGNSSNKFTNDKQNILVMTQPLCNPEKRIEMYGEIIKEYGEGFNVYIKPHPIDTVDYQNVFPDCIVLERFFPIEIFNFRCELNIEKIITVYTILDDLTFAKQKIRLGIKYLDKYEDPVKHKYLIDLVK